MAIGGDIREITYNHPTLGVGSLYPKSNEDSTFDNGGLRSVDDDNMVTGSGEMIDQMNMIRWSFEGTIAWDGNVRDEAKILKQLAASPVKADWTISHVNGTVWGGKGKPVGDIKPNGNTATMSIKLAGDGELKKIVG
jgi:hypothetical protein